MMTKLQINYLSNMFKRVIAVAVKRTYTTTSALPCPQTTKPTNNAPHIPVLCNEAIAYLNPQAHQIFVDMTFGAGGHTRQLLEAEPTVRVFALDRDPVAHQLAIDMSIAYAGRLTPLLGRFSELPQLLQQHGVQLNTLDGMLFDFGCSSMQFDEAARGFSISKDGPLDMRMDRGRLDDQITAADLLARIDEPDLVRILRVYGEEKAAKKIARAVIETRSVFGRIETTGQLCDLVASCFKESSHRLDKLQRPTHLATKTFQALRIFINNELNEINYAMLLAYAYLKPTGRMVTITFHSLEDTIVKRHINGNIVEGAANVLPLKYCSHYLTHDKEHVDSLTESHWQQLHKHVIVPSAEEIALNSRSRSAKLRAATKL